MQLNNTPIPWSPVRIVGKSRVSDWLIICDHASNCVPPFIPNQDLGIAADDMNRHIAFDPGAAGVAEKLAKVLEAPLVMSDFSRLVIDPNRGEDDPTLVMQLYDGTVIPTNRHLSRDEVNKRLDLCYRPYHQAITDMATRQDNTVIVSLHSFTPQLRGRAPREWHAGMLFAGDDRLSRPLIKMLHNEGFIVGENEPYTGALKGDTIDRHAIQAGRQNTLIEIRNDLIQTSESQNDWANRLARLLPLALDEAS